MPTLPSRSRSVRKPISHAAVASTDSGAASATTTTDQTTSGTSKFERNNDLSPSRLPVKPTRSSSRIHSSKESSLQQNPLRNHAFTATKISNTPIEELQRSTSSRQSKNISTSELEPIKKDRSRPPVAAASRNLRPTSSNSSVHIRGPSKSRERSSSTLTSSSYSRPPTRNSISSDVADRASSYMLDKKPLKKPLFSIHQQHYSPAKNLAPKLHPAAFLAPPTPSKWPANKAISAETTKLQNELLQLHLIHRDCGHTEKEWQASAKSKLEARFLKIVEMEHNILEKEKCENSKLNAIALKEWQEVGAPGWGLDEKIHIFDNILTGLMNTRDARGRYARATQKFEKWVDLYEDVFERREKKFENYAETLLIEELDSNWKNDCFYLRRKLELWKDNIRDLGIPQSESSLELLVDQVQRIILGMLSEIDFMTRLEREVMGREEHWIKLMNDRMLDDVRKQEGPEAGAIWRSIGVMKNS
ncbi:hypothetical protein EPUL_002751 [Erysiphe pulchra]|uniref:Uncharacterized protein n=1 Tax=Erysiphe pulchra TaxID=225359 RepID=A0A2S4PZC6_9PEZI|nr:hypothetical protein EPUL_002751 [Erysiphe pulchra]